MFEHFPNPTIRMQQVSCTHQLHSSSTITYVLMIINSILVVWYPSQAIYFTDYYTSLSEEPAPVTQGKNIQHFSLQSFQPKTFSFLLSAISIYSLISIEF